MIDTTVQEIKHSNHTEHATCGCAFETFPVAEGTVDVSTTSPDDKILDCNLSNQKHLVPIPDYIEYLEALCARLEYLSALAMDKAGLREKYAGKLLDEIIKDLEQ